MSEKTSLDRRFETAEKLYYFEHDRQEKLFSRVPVMIAIYSILLSTMAAYIDSLPSGEHDFEVWMLRLGLVVEGIALVVSGYFTWKFLWPDHGYGHLVSRSTVVHAEPADAGEEGDESGQGAEVVTQELLNLYEGMAAQNYINNQNRSAHVMYALRWLMLGAGIALASAVPYFFIKSEHKGDAHKVEIMNFPGMDTMRRLPEVKEQSASASNGSRPHKDADAGKEKEERSSGSGFGAVYVRPGDSVEKSKKRGDWNLRK